MENMFNFNILMPFSLNMRHILNKYSYFMPKFHVTTECAVIRRDVRIILGGATAQLIDGWLCLLVPFITINMCQASRWYYYCYVPKCRSTTKATPSKRFINLPKNKKIRRQWWVSARCDFPMREYYLRYYFTSSLIYTLPDAFWEGFLN